MNPNLRKNILTHSLVILAFFMINLFVHYPALISGLSISQHDILEGVGGNRQLIEFRSQTGNEALWNPNMFSGMPAYFTGVQYSGDLIKYVSMALGLWMGHPSSILFIGMVCFYIMLLTFKVRPLIAAIGAVAFSLNGFNVIVIMAGHNAKIAAVALMTTVVAGVRLNSSGNKCPGAALTPLPVALDITPKQP